ncbi:MAG TPA: cytochrome c [Chromatiales bacterium]|nr:cytochrome c [Chromatiales bacterium]
MNRSAIVFVTVFLLMVVGKSVEAGDAAAGKAKAATCGGCHGANGVSQAPMYPNLAGQKQEYLAKAITAYKSGSRNDPSMKAMVSALSDEDIQNVAAYYAGLSCK